MTQNVGFFGGSFDPIHFGHLDLAIEMLEMHGLDEILFCPAFCSPFKVDRPPSASARHRFEMLKLVLAEVPQFRVTDIELVEEAPSYTVETLEQLKQPNVQFRLLLTKESAAHFSFWKDPEEIARIAPPLVGERHFPISSTAIRERLKKKLYCGHLVPAIALDYIHKHRLYSS